MILSGHLIGHSPLLCYLAAPPYEVQLRPVALLDYGITKWCSFA